MHSIHLKTTVGSDGVLRVQLPPEYQGQELEAIVILELLPKSELANPPKASGWQPGFFEEVVGGWVGEPLGREDQGESEIGDASARGSFEHPHPYSQQVFIDL